ncbi:MAG: ABC transporter permease [Candidatus Auribacter fodinae]|jgi:ABC-type dipeptide/oligopeptide/nickel transport system permease component|uniref:ABC transporter permease n=1 Tax=Candidatus Auribacter fodinae TaxID=2093366 RepID=A0A3A4QQZ6_9BACT|nr:MAG: ABC transporter permease [Candidatus Auribacter fodinae]
MPFVYVLKRLTESIPTLIGVTLITFVLLKCAPGNPIYSIVGERVSQDRIEELKKSLQAGDTRWWKQYGAYMGNILKGDFGESYITREPVLKALSVRFPNTLKLALFSIVLAVVSGLLLGIISAYVRSTFWNQVFTILSTCGISTPVFWFGLLLIYVFSRLLNVLPASGMGNGELAYLVLPAITLGSRSAAYIARITCTSLEEVRKSRFVLSAWARGISPLSVVFRHTLKNALIPIVTVIGLDIGSYLNGSVLTETIFGWNGVGRLLVQAIYQRDYPLIMGGILIGTFIFIMVNIIMDIVYAFIDPRIELR